MHRIGDAYGLTKTDAICSLPSTISAGRRVLRDQTFAPPEAGEKSSAQARDEAPGVGSGPEHGSIVVPEGVHEDILVVPLDGILKTALHLLSEYGQRFLERVLIVERERRVVPAPGLLDQPLER